MLGIGEELVGKLLDRPRHGCRKQKRLPRRGKLGTDALDVRNEAHVEHAVRFVDHQQFASVKEDVAAIKQIHQPPGRGNQHVDAFFERLHLITHRNAADQQGHGELVVLAVFFEIFGNLRGQFARRLKNERARHPCAAAPMGKNVDHRQDEAGRFARSGLRNTNQIAHHQHRRDGARLDRGRLGIAGLIDRF